MKKKLVRPSRLALTEAHLPPPRHHQSTDVPLYLPAALGLCIELSPSGEACSLPIVNKQDRHASWKSTRGTTNPRFESPELRLRMVPPEAVERQYGDKTLPMAARTNTPRMARAARETVFEGTMPPMDPALRATECDEHRKKIATTTQLQLVLRPNCNGRMLNDHEPFRYFVAQLTHHGVWVGEQRM